MLYYRSTLIYNFSFSLIGLLNGIETFIIFLLFLGPFAAFALKEFSGKREYYFYYNNAITKFQLMLSVLLINLVCGSVLFIILAIFK